MSDWIVESLGYIRKNYAEACADVTVGIVCGSGLGNLTTRLTNPVTVQYVDIPSFPRSTVHGHAGELVFGMLGEKKVVCMRGRFHIYEGWSAEQSVSGVKLMITLGIKMLIVTNAAGGTNPEFKTGDVMMMNGHINLPGMTGFHPLRGANDERFGPRFPNMNSVYDTNLMAQFRQTAEEIKFSPTMHTGCYVALSGPSYETPQEVEFVRKMGGDAVGMSTAAEVTVAAHSGIPVVGLSMITNECLGPNDAHKTPPTHQEVIEIVDNIGQAITDLVEKFVSDVDLSAIPESTASKHFAGVKSRPVDYKKYAQYAATTVACVAAAFLIFKRRR